MKILIIEDEKALSNSIADYLDDSAYICEIANDFKMAMNRLYDFDYDCVILDISLPDGNGLKILEHLKAEERAEGVIIVSARNALDDKLDGLRIGADDYLTKPFHLAELKARVDAIIRRKGFEGKSIVRFDGLEIDTEQWSFKAGGIAVELTKKELELLLYFISNKNRVISKSAIVGHLWGEEIDMMDNYDVLYAHIKNLRKKLQKNTGKDYIQSIYGMGYKFVVV